MENSIVDQSEEVNKLVIDSLGRLYATGRRKESVARVWIKPGDGKFSVNRKNELFSYFKRESICQIVRMPLIITSVLDKYDVFATVKGGGLSSQAGALAHGVSRALSKTNQSLRFILRSKGFLTRDSRVVERKKYGRHKARKRCQFSKR
ncbi:30S ribosomal protein S9 [Wolbachia endosymbiont of Dipetalonema caudispina]|uniref:30S ribosomal protein S9 n=1 Tax=Wolbachia endosymbiont of Dipetalonema caudispina TaxID=1812112 RepID=UPI00158C5368|nr:30S ribosomal protein S9 [Wolbachia endosymbiont of Dipetalonema caudispina]MCV3769196.1 30S ribosomal protein S9 [Wolbachia pipientis]QKX01194.1 30S ribosomal protein S9 [Wolbachia endosymbiont of Dipetalonema caudispina]